MSARPIRSITEVIGLLARGHFAEKCDEALTQIIEALENQPDEKGSASLMITLNFTRVQDRLDLKPKVTTKLPPEKDLPSTVFWPVDGALSVQHPSQMSIFDSPRGVTPERRFDRTAEEI